MTTLDKELKNEQNEEEKMFLKKDFFMHMQTNKTAVSIQAMTSILEWLNHSLLDGQVLEDISVERHRHQMI